MVRTGVMRAYGAYLRRRLGAGMNNRLAAFLGGLGVTLVLQSSAATSLMAASFAGRGLVKASAILAVLLGADVGTSLVTQVFSFNISYLSPLLILGGVISFMSGQSTKFQDMGRAIIGVGLILLALHLIGAVANPIRDSVPLQGLLASLANEAVLGMVIATLLTLLSTSSLAVVLLTVSLAASGAIALPLALAMVLGANIGSAILPVMATAKGEPSIRRGPVGNLLFRVSAAAVALVFLKDIGLLLAQIEAGSGRQVANMHTAFNIALALFWLPWTSPVAALLERLFPDRPEPDDQGLPRYLDENAMETPSAAIASAARETLRQGDIVGNMLRLTMDVFRNDDRKLAREVERMDDIVDRLHEAIKLYLTRVSSHTLDSEESRRCVDALTFTTNLEHVGDIIDKNLMELAAKKIKNNLRFSREGLGEIEAMHRRISDNLKLALNVFVAGDVKMARQLLEEKVFVREMERKASDAHLDRLRSGKLETLETSSLHLDVLRDLKRINSHLTSVAYPILEASGELARSRLKIG